MSDPRPLRADWRGVLDDLAARLSCRDFDGSSMPDAVLAEIVGDGIEAPSSCNHQNWHFVVVTDRALLERAREIAGGNPHFGTCSALIYLCFQKGYTHGNFSIVQSVAAACYHMMLSAHLRGYACIWNAGIGPHDPIRAMLDLPQEFEVQGALAIGVPVPDVARIKPPRRDVSEVVSWNGFQRPAHARYPLKPADAYPYFEIRNEDNPFAQWNPSHWTWAQIADFRGYAVWAKTPLAGIYVSQRHGDATVVELGLLAGQDMGGTVVEVMPWGGTTSAALAAILPETAHLRISELSENATMFISERLAREGVAMDRVSFDLMEEGALPYADGSVDTVVMLQSLEHCPDPQAMLDEVCRVLRPGGLSLIGVRNALSSYGALWEAAESKAQIPNQGPFRPLAAMQVEAWIAERFDIVRAVGIGREAHGDAALSDGPDRLGRRLYTVLARR